VLPGSDINNTNTLLATFECDKLLHR